MSTQGASYQNGGPAYGPSPLASAILLNHIGQALSSQNRKGSAKEPFLPLPCALGLVCIRIVVGPIPALHGEWVQAIRGGCRWTGGMSLSIRSLL